MTVRWSTLDAGLHLLSGKFLIAISVRGSVDARTAKWPEVLGQLRNSETSPEIELTSFQFVLQFLNQLRYNLFRNLLYELQ